MDKFHSMEDFCLRCSGELKGYPSRGINIHMDGASWAKYYLTAKASWEKYGNCGPPIGSKVETLRAGFSGGSGAIRFILEIKDIGAGNKPYMCFLLYKKMSKFDPMEDYTLINGINYSMGGASLVTDWYLDFKVLDEPNENI